MNMKNPGALIKGLAKMQSQMTTIQKTIAQSRYEGTSGGGLVKVTIFGTGKVDRIDLDPAVLEEGSELVGELITAAMNVAIDNREADCKVKLKGVGGSLVPGFIPGL